MRGTIVGTGKVIMDSAVQVNPGGQGAYEVGESGSHTLRSRDFEDSETLRGRLIEATVEALPDSNNPRLVRSRLLP